MHYLPLSQEDAKVYLSFHDVFSTAWISEFQKYQIVLVHEVSYADGYKDTPWYSNFLYDDSL